MTLIIVQILSILVLAWPAACEFLNGFGEDVEFNCLPGHAIDTIESNQISNIQKRRKRTDEYDREWTFDCIQVSKHVKEYCDDYTTINDAGGLMLFQCPKNSYMRGIKSVYNPPTDDRVWEVKCCRVLGKCTRDCCLSDPINELGGPMDYSPTEGVFFVGIFSKYDDAEKYLESRSCNNSWDRIFYVEQCKAVDCGRPYNYKYKNPWENKSAWVK